MAVDSRSGRTLWRVASGGADGLSLGANDDLAVALFEAVPLPTSERSSTLRAISMRTGATLWQRQLDAGVNGARIHITLSAVIVDRQVAGEPVVSEALILNRRTGSTIASVKDAVLARTGGGRVWLSPFLTEPQRPGVFYRFQLPEGNQIRDLYVRSV